MININKFVFFATIMVAVIFSTSCERNKELTNTNEKTNTLVESYSKSSPLENNPILRNLNKDLTYLYYSYDNIENVFYGKDLLKEIKWNRREENKEVFDANVILDYSDFGDMEVENNNDESFSLKLENTTVKIENFAENNGFITFDSKLPDGRLLNYGIYLPEIGLSNFIEFLKSNNFIKNPFGMYSKEKWIMEALTAVAIVVTVVTVVTLVVSNEKSKCDRQVASGIANCQVQGLCSKVNGCVVTCYDCNKPHK